MMNFSLLLNCHGRAPAECLGLLGIAPADVASYTSPTPDFLKRQRNGALVSEAHGAFSHVADVFLYDRDPATMDAALLALSREGIDLAMPVPGDPDPEVHWYWQAGYRKLLRVVDDEGVLALVDPLGDHGID